MNYVNRTAFEKHKERFIGWLKERGASMLTPTNEWELARWKGGDTTSIVYTNSRGGITFSGDSAKAWTAFRSGNNGFRVAPAAKRAHKASPVIRALRERDGHDCFYCAQAVDDESASVEHIVPVTHGGPSHMSNYALAHRQCNANAGHLSAMEKFSIRLAAITNSPKRVQPE